MAKIIVALLVVFLTAQAKAEPVLSIFLNATSIDSECAGDCPTIIDDSADSPVGISAGYFFNSPFIDVGVEAIMTMEYGLVLSLRKIVGPVHITLSGGEILQEVSGPAPTTYSKERGSYRIDEKAPYYSISLGYAVTKEDVLFLSYAVTSADYRINAMRFDGYAGTTPIHTPVVADVEVEKRYTIIGYRHSF